MQLPNQRPGKPDRLSQNAQAQTTYPRVQCEHTLDKRGCKSPNPQTSRVPLKRIHQDKLSSIKQGTTGQASKLEEHPQTTLQETRQEA